MPHLPTLRPRAWLGALGAALLAAPLMALPPELHPDDRALLERLDPILGGVTAQAPFSADSGVTRAEVEALLERQRQPVDAQTLPGDWRCRSIQVDLGFPVAYPYFKCRIRATEAGLFFEKTTGSQRRSGLLFPEAAEALVFLGSFTVNEEPQEPYSGLETEADGESSVNDSVGRLWRLAPDHALMAFPRARDAFELYELKR